MFSILHHIGKYFIMLTGVFRRPEKFRIYVGRTIVEVDKIGLSSLGIVVLMSLFMGAVIALQTASNIDSPLIPSYTVGFTTRQSIILEFSPTIICLILAGKVGSNIASELGTMRISEQIDALDIMGINSRAYLIAPKIIASIFIFPFLIVFSMFLGIFGGWLVCSLSGIIAPPDYVEGLLLDFKPFHITYALVKTVLFAFIITTVSSYHGYYTKGGAIAVGRSSTQAVVYSSVLILIVNYIVTQLILI
jgi:phospholipid/cholesterol/gamma-HCH transport system permease protein